VDGVNNASLIQAGTAQDSSNGATAYDEWYEILPANETLIASVSPGDHIQACINEGSLGTWTIAISDITSGQSFSQAFAYSASGTSAEWVEEAPKVNGLQAALANFGTVQFTDMAWAGNAFTITIRAPTRSNRQYRFHMVPPPPADVPPASEIVGTNPGEGRRRTPPERSPRWAESRPSLE
jgi:hypothetical protein